MRKTLTKNLLVVLCLLAAPVTALKVYEIYPGRIINGQPADATKFPDIVKIRTSGAGCTATLVGPKVILTAAHCGRNGQVSVFTMDGQQRKATITRSGIYPGKDHDIALGLMDKAVRNVKPRTIGKVSPQNGDTLTHYGYGCTKPGGGGGNDGVLRFGDARVTGTSGYDIISKGAGLCYGDSGGSGHQLHRKPSWNRLPKLPVQVRFG